MRYFTIFYTVLVGCSTFWAWIIHFSMKNSGQEHLLPSILLNFSTMPLSLLLEPILVKFPQLLNSSVPGLLLMTGMGIVQVVLLWWISARIK